MSLLEHITALHTVTTLLTSILYVVMITTKAGKVKFYNFVVTLFVTVTIVIYMIISLSNGHVSWWFISAYATMFVVSVAKTFFL